MVIEHETWNKSNSMVGSSDPSYLRIFTCRICINFRRLMDRVDYSPPNIHTNSMHYWMSFACFRRRYVNLDWIRIEMKHQALGSFLKANHLIFNNIAKKVKQRMEVSLRTPRTTLGTVRSTLLVCTPWTLVLVSWIPRRSLVLTPPTYLPRLLRESSFLDSTLQSPVPSSL